ncbi:MAG: hypothetical protein ACTS3R_07945, partial [Inquilinaceae bacterium]
RHPKSPANAIFIFVILLSIMSVGPLGMAPAQETLHWMIAALIAGTQMLESPRRNAAGPPIAVRRMGSLRSPPPAGA